MSRWTSDCVSSVPGYRSSGLLWSFFSDDTATAEFCTLSLHDALPILVREAILRELDRGGQVYYVHNRVQSIEIVHRRLRELVPEARFLIGHGQMAEEQLERVMLDFAEGKADVLICTTIIESGLDISNTNTAL